jgi:hypothetical protein
MIVVSEKVADVLRDMGMVEYRDFLVEKTIPRGWNPVAAVRSLMTRTRSAAA